MFCVLSTQGSLQLAKETVLAAKARESLIRPLEPVRPREELEEIDHTVAIPESVDTEHAKEEVSDTPEIESPAVPTKHVPLDAKSVAHCRTWKTIFARQRGLAQEEEEQANGLLDEADDWDADDKLMLPGGSVNNRRRFIGHCARVAKARFGLPQRSKANQLAVRDFLRKYMEEHGHRPSHIARDIEMSVELVFIPSNADVEVQRLRASRAYTRRCEFFAEEPAPTRSWWQTLTGQGHKRVSGFAA